MGLIDLTRDDDSESGSPLSDLPIFETSPKERFVHRIKFNHASILSVKIILLTMYTRYVLATVHNDYSAS